MKDQHRIAGIVDRIGKRARTRFPRGSAVGDALRAVRRHLPASESDHPIVRVIAAFGAHHPDAFVVQVGAHDGTAIDPLRAEILRRRWRGILVEPVPYVFERLKANYGRNPRLVLENAAIADTDGTREFYYLAETADSGVWEWYDALGSFRRDVLLGHRDLIPDIEGRVRSMLVPCLTFESLCSKHSVTRIDVVQIDTEGYDFEVLRLIDLARWRPAIVMYEHVHLDDAEQRAARARLDDHGYECFVGGMDVLAVHSEVLASHPDLRTLWADLVAAGSPEES